MIASGCFTATAANTTLKASLDSTFLLMGKTTAIKLELVQDKNTIGYFTADAVNALSEQIEIAERPKADTVDLGNNRIQINKQYIIQAFDSGMYVIKPFEYVIGKDTVKSNQLTIKVLPVSVNPEEDIIGYADVIDPPRKFFDWLPDFIADYWWAILAALAAIAGGIFAYRRWYKKGINPLKPKKKLQPPYDEAMARLNSLKEQHLWEKGEDKAYYTELTDILRVYIERRFGVNAVEMTTSQILDTLHHHEETQLVNSQLNDILAVADFVKFAGHHPDAQANELSFDQAVEFVERTKPLPQQPANEKNDDAKGGEQA